MGGGSKLWTRIDAEDGLFNGKYATYYDVKVTYQTPRVRAGIAISDGSVLEFHLNIPKELQQQGIATEIFKNAIGDYYPNKVKGWWKKMDIYSGGESVNLTIFKEKYHIYKLTMSEKEAAIKAAFDTPTGKLAHANGFDGIPEIIKNELDEVIILFNPQK